VLDYIVTKLGLLTPFQSRYSSPLPSNFELQLAPHGHE